MMAHQKIRHTLCGQHAREIIMSKIRSLNVVFIVLMSCSHDPSEALAGELLLYEMCIYIHFIKRGIL